mgnify:CR=1 FL=1
MKRCDRLVDVGRRQFLRGGVVATAGAAAATVVPTDAKAKPGTALVRYPVNKLTNVKDLKTNEPLDVGYPDADAPGVLLKLGKKVEGGVGPDGDIVGFSTVWGMSRPLLKRLGTTLPRSWLGGLLGGVNAEGVSR